VYLVVVVVVEILAEAGESPHLPQQITLLAAEAVRAYVIVELLALPALHLMDPYPPLMLLVRRQAIREEEPVEPV